MSSDQVGLPARKLALHCPKMAQLCDCSGKSPMIKLVLSKLCTNHCSLPKRRLFSLDMLPFYAGGELIYNFIWIIFQI